MKSLDYYVNRFQHLRVDRSKGEAAPHKSILLLAIIEEVACGVVSGNQIYITPELVARFKDLFTQLVSSQKFVANFALPFYHLKSEGFWFLKTKPGREIFTTSSASIRSFSHLQEVVEYAYFEDELFTLLLDNDTRSVLKQTLLQTYFPFHPSLSDVNLLTKRITEEILEAAPALYRAKAKLFDEEEVFVRGGIFKREIPRIYNNTCCISGMRLISGNIRMVDACHIVPFSEGYDDTISNGLCLCPNLHRAFDRGLISIDEQYRVVMKPFVEATDSEYLVKPFEGRKVLLPKEQERWPAQANLAAHRSRFGFEIR